MAATIQTIQKPTKARALDTSTSIQESKEMITDGNFPDSTNWSLGDDWTIGSNKATCTNDAGDNNGNLIQNHFSGSYVKGYGDQEHYEPGVTYRCTYTVSDYDNHSSGSSSFRFLLYSNTYSDYGNGTERVWVGLGTSRTANGTYTEDITISHNAGSHENQTLIQTNSDPITVSISNLSIRKLESFGNNNHGQIYSGRALEFDGVTDYFQHNGGTALAGVNQFADNVDWTFACWMNTNSSGEQLFVGNDNSTQPHLLIEGSGDYLAFRADDSDYFRFSQTALELNTWYRVVYVASSNTITAYVNGVKYGDTITTSTERYAGSGSAPTTFPGSAMEFSGWGCPYGGARSLHFSGMMSDGQVWDAAWTADDVLYDYNNPESLALNRGGTSLTNSNLKIWYPMNDGHRGQQSYILDASNTGLGDDVLTNSSFLEWTVPSGQAAGDDPTYWGVGNEDAYNYVTQLSGGGFRFDWAKGGTVADLYINQTATVVGVSYKATVKINAISGSGAYLRFYSAPTNHGEFTTVGTHSVYFTATSTTLTFARSGSNESYAEIEYLKVEPINDKNHATTVFYGDELIASDAADNRTFDNDTGNWAAHDVSGSAASSIANNSNKLRVTTGGDASTNEGAKLDEVHVGNGTTTSIVAGRTYQISAKITRVSGYDPITLRYNIGGASSDTFNVTGSEDTYTKNVTTINNTGPLYIFLANPSSGNASAVYDVDDVSVKEVGTASGWTDADQQLDIPQTALQSFNQLAWFDGVADCMTISDHGDFTFGTGSDDTPFSVSAWVFIGEASATGTGGGIVAKYSSGQAEWSLSLLDGYIRFYTYDQSETAHIGTKTDNRADVGKWLHVVGTYSGNENSSGFKIYINGEEITSSDYTGGSGYAAMDNQSSDVKIGEHSTDFLLGSVTEVSIWGTALSQAEIKELYNDGKAIDCLQHSQYISDPTELVAYWRNNGITKWVNLKNPGTHDASITSLIETMLITPGVDGSRDSQGFLMNRQKTTNSLNLYNPLYNETNSPSLKEAPYVFIPKAPLMTDSTAVTNFSICAWIKWNRTPNQANGHTNIYDDVQEVDDGVAKGLKLSVNSGNILQCYVWWGIRNDTGPDPDERDFIYSKYDLDNIDQATITNPHSFGADGMWNGTQTSMAESKGIAYPADDMLSGSLPPDKWFHVAVTFDHDNAEGATNETANPASNITAEAPFYTYVNGILVAKNGIDGSDDEAVADNFDKTMYATIDHAAIIGSDMMGTLPKPGNNVNDTHGEIDELLMYSDTLTSKEVLRIYNAGKRSHK